MNEGKRTEEMGRERERLTLLVDCGYTVSKN